jgi:hypothetical protein
MICTPQTMEQIMDDPRHGNPQPWPQHPQQQPPPGYYGPPQGYVQPPPRREYLAGMSTGENIIHGVITVCTLGLWAPIWWLRSRMRRKAIR